MKEGYNDLVTTDPEIAAEWNHERNKELSPHHISRNSLRYVWWKDTFVELLNDENNSLWSAVLYGIGYSDDQIVAVALSQIGNYGGAPYWS